MSEWDPWRRYWKEQERRRWDPLSRYDYERERERWDPYFRFEKQRERELWDPWYRAERELVDPWRRYERRIERKYSDPEYRRELALRDFERWGYMYPALERERERLRELDRSRVGGVSGNEVWEIARAQAMAELMKPSILDYLKIAGVLGLIGWAAYLFFFRPFP